MIAVVVLPLTWIALIAIGALIAASSTVVVIGAGGIYAEILGSVARRVAPISRREAEAICREAEVSFDSKAGDLSDDDVNKLRKIVDAKVYPNVRRAA